MKFLFPVLIFLFSFSIKAQTVKVIDKVSLEEIRYAEITSNDPQLRIITDTKGEANLSAFKSSDTIYIYVFGYAPLVTSYKALQQNKFVVFLEHQVLEMEEVILSVNKFGEKRSDLPQDVQVIKARDIEFMNQPTTAEMLQHTGNVFVQKSQMGGGSPVIRGFEANKILIMVDGVRMNNAIFRGGHLQNIISMDDASLERTEIVYGPGSVLYGSDALGGVIHLYTKDPILADSSSSSNIKGNGYTRYSTAFNEKAAHVDFNLGFKKAAFFTSFTYADFGDLRQGNNRNDFYGDWGKRNYYAERINGKDSMLKNSDPNIQKGTAYNQFNLMEKILFQPGKSTRHILNIQLSGSTDIPRYDRLTEVTSGGKLKYSDWYYGPQKRFMASYSLRLNKESKLYNRAQVTAAYQNMQESRHDRRFGNPILNHRFENVDAYSLNIDMDKKAGKHELRYGAEAIYNTVNSTAYKENIQTGIHALLDTRYPDAGSTMWMYSAYVSHAIELSDKLTLSEGIRYNRIHLHSEFKDTSFFPFPFREVNQKNNALNGNAGLVYIPGYNWRFSLLGSTGFRAPNVDDLAKVFESVAGNLIVPNPSLKPEYTYNAELGISKKIKHVVELEGRFFYTWYRNALTTGPAMFKGQDSVLYNGQNSRVITTVNAARAYVYGLNVHLLATITNSFSISSSVTYTYGRIQTDTVPYPLDHVPPVFGRTGLNLELKKFKGEFFVLYNGWKRLKNYNLKGEDNIQFATSYGTPAWITLNLRTSYHINKYLQVQIGLENILDQNYRVFASGVNAPGRNLIVTLRGKL